MKRAAKWTGWITLAGLVAAAALLLTWRNAHVAAGREHQSDQDRIGVLETWRTEHDATITRPGMDRLATVEKKVDATNHRLDLLMLWLRMVGRAEGWPPFPDESAAGRLPDPWAPGLYAAEIAAHRCP